MADLTRREEIANRLAVVRTRIDRACDAAGRDPAEVTLIAITKTFPVSDIEHLLALGVADIGENRDQEAAPKAAALEGRGVRWHFVGQLQTNKCRSVAAYAQAVHSVDRLRLVGALSAAAERTGRRIEAFIEVALHDDPGRGGVPPLGVAEVAAAIATSAGLQLAGLMAVAPLGADPVAAFARLAEIAADVRSRHPAATGISAGMSGDLEAAIGAGATHVRVGTALLGGRPPLVR